jgi:hypothetical protein
LGKSNRPNDFSNGSGFYLSDNFSEALKWAEKRSTIGSFSAVLRYKVPKQKLKDSDGLHLSEDVDLWRKIVRYFRSDFSIEKDMKCYRKKDFIVGPLSKDGSWKPNKDDPDWPQPLENSWRQLCILNNILADDFNLFLDRVALVESAIRQKKGRKKMPTSAENRF